MPADLRDRLPTDDESEILDFLAAFPETWGRPAGMRDLSEHFRGAAINELLLSLHHKGYLRRGRTGQIEMLAPLIGEIR